MIIIGNDAISASIQEQGAELCSLRDGLGDEFLWQAGPAWPRHSPVLFPIVGEVAGGRYRVDGREYQLGRHGFARDCRFAVAGQSAQQARFTLADNDATRAVYPFPFRLSLDYRAAGAGLRVTYIVENPGAEPLPFSIGAHPAFNWPEPRTAQSLVFDNPEPEPVRRLEGGLLAPLRFASPVRGDELPLSDDLFAHDALIFDAITSRGVRFGRLRVSWCDEMPFLAVWSKHSANFLCIEPWAGHSDPVGYMGELQGKAGVVLLGPGEAREFWWEVAIEPARPGR